MSLSGKLKDSYLEYISSIIQENTIDKKKKEICQHILVGMKRRVSSIETHTTK